MGERMGGCGEMRGVGCVCCTEWEEDKVHS